MGDDAIRVLATAPPTRDRAMRALDAYRRLVQGFGRRSTPQ